MTREEYLGYLNDQTKEVTPVMFFYYKLKGGHLNEESFTFAFMHYAAILGRVIGEIHFHVFKELNKHFKIEQHG